jgi:8-oxo-dGTP pyrophosphatase MutT (NUDIX family)
VLDLLYADTRAVLTGWTATSPAADAARQRTLTLLDAGPVAMTRAHRPGHVTASALVVDPDGRLLLCLHGRFHRWMQLGGHCELTDETLAAAALREATEESGLAGLRIHSEPVDVDVHPVRCAGPDGGPAEPSAHFDVRFAVVCPPGAVERVSAESHALGWFAPDALPAPLAHGTAQLVAPTLARVSGGGWPEPAQT